MRTYVLPFFMKVGRFSVLETDKICPTIVCERIDRGCFVSLQSLNDQNSISECGTDNGFHFQVSSKAKCTIRLENCQEGSH